MRFSFALVVLALLPGCGFVAAATGRFEEPALRIVASKVESVRHNHLRVTFGLELFNPNAYALHLTNFKYAVEISDTVVAEGGLDETVELPAEGVATVHLPLELHLDSIRAAALRALSLGELPYKLTASGDVGALFIERSLSYSESSVLRIVPHFGLGRWLERLGLGGASISG